MKLTIAYKAMELSLLYSTVMSKQVFAPHIDRLHLTGISGTTRQYRRDCGLIRLILLRANVQLHARNCDCIYVGLIAQPSDDPISSSVMISQRLHMSHGLLNNTECITCYRLSNSTT